ncbi:MAG: hypothetical protein ABL931_02920 [Usitatibacteraceae bacterium]
MSWIFGPFPALMLATSRKCRISALAGLTTAVIGAAMFLMSSVSLAESRTGSASGRAGLDFRIVVPPIVRATLVAQPDRVVIEERHVTAGSIDMDAGTSVKLTSNNREGYVLAASYDTGLLSKVDVRVSHQNLVASSGFGSIRVRSGLAVEQLTPIAYRFYLLPGVRAGSYRWPVALTFSPVAV